MVFYRLPMDYGDRGVRRYRNGLGCAEPTPSEEGGGGGPSLTLVSHWTLDNTSWLDSTGSLNLTPSGTVTSVAGFTNNCANFGTTLSNLSTAGLETGNIDWKFESYVRLASLSSTEFLIAGRIDNDFLSEDAGAAEWALTARTAGFRLRLYRNDFTTAVQVNAATFGSLSTATWYFVECGFIGGEAFISVDGVTDTGTPSLPPTVVPSATFILGGTEFLFATRTNTRVDEAKFYL